MFLSEISKNLKNVFSYGTPLVAASDMINPSWF